MSFTLTHCPICFDRLTFESIEDIGKNPPYHHIKCEEKDHYFFAAYIKDWNELTYYQIRIGQMKVCWDTNQFIVFLFPPPSYDPKDIQVGEEVLWLNGPAPSQEEQLFPEKLMKKMETLIVFQ